MWNSHIRKKISLHLLLLSLSSTLLLQDAGQYAPITSSPSIQIDEEHYGLKVEVNYETWWADVVDVLYDVGEEGADGDM